MIVSSTNSTAATQQTSSNSSYNFGLNPNGFGAALGASFGGLLATGLQAVAQNMQNVELNQAGSNVGSWVHNTFLQNSDISNQAASEIGEAGGQLVEGVIQVVADKPAESMQSTGMTLGAGIGMIGESLFGSIFNNVLNGLFAPKS